MKMKIFDVRAHVSGVEFKYIDVLFTTGLNKYLRLVMCVDFSPVFLFSADYAFEPFNISTCTVRRKCRRQTLRHSTDFDITF